MVDEIKKVDEVKKQLSDDDVIFADYKPHPLFNDEDEDDTSSITITREGKEEKAIFAEPEEEAQTAESSSAACLKGKIEAVLFITGKALTVQEIAEIVGASVTETEDELIGLIQDMSFREGSALEIDDTDGYILQVKEEYADIVNKMMPLEISAAELRTLSAIALKGPVLQSDLVELRGAIIYEHIPTLLERKLISKRREGRSFVVNVTRNFYEYFKLMGDKKELKGLVEKLGREPGRRRVSDTPDNTADDDASDLIANAQENASPLEEAAS